MKNVSWNNQSVGCGFNLVPSEYKAGVHLTCPQYLFILNKLSVFLCNVLQVHRLVLNACTEYFQMLEKQGFVIGDCLRMPHDLQADVVLPIIKYVPFSDINILCTAKAFSLPKRTIGTRHRYANCQVFAVVQMMFPFMDMLHHWVISSWCFSTR